MENPVIVENTAHEHLAEALKSIISLDNKHFTALLEQHKGVVRDVVVAEVERLLVDQSLHYCQGNQTLVSATLGITRCTLRNKIRILNIKGWRWTRN